MGKFEQYEYQYEHQDQDEKDIHDALSRIIVDTSSLSDKVTNRLNEKTYFYKPHGGRFSLAVALVISIMLIITVAGFALGKFDWFMEKINPSFGEIVEPVGVVSEDQGIRMEVIGAQKYNNMAVIYLSLQDISGQKRLTEKTDFRDGFSVKMNVPVEDPNSESDHMLSSMSYRDEVLYFDKESNTIYFQFTVEASSVSPLSDPLTLGSFLIYFDEKKYEYEPIPISLSELTETEGIPIEEDYVFGGTNLSGDGSEYTNILELGNYAPMPHGKDEQWVSNIGIIEGKLHVQIGQLFNRDFGTTDASLLLKDSNGELIEADYAIDVLSYKDNRLFNIHKAEDYENATYKYIESVFTVDTDKLDDYTLCFLGSVYSGVKGRWKVATNLSDTTNQIRTLTNDIWVDGNLFKHITITPLGLEVNGIFEGDEYTASEMSLALETTNGTLTLEGGGGGFNEKEHIFNVYWNTKKPLDVETVTAVIINGTRIEIK